MKFDMLCNIILEGKKQHKFARIHITNSSPTFAMEDVLRDPDDPSRGVKTYLDEQLKGSESDDAPDEERIARRALRRLNWVAGTLIKRIGSRELDLRKLHLNIIILLEKYLTNVLRYSDERIAQMELKIAKEAAFIGNLLLPPSDRLPNAKGVFSIVSDNISERPTKDDNDDNNLNISIADQLSKEFNMTVDEYIAAFDPDLIETIKDVIRDGDMNKSTPVDDLQDEIAEEGFDAGVERDIEGVTVREILKDPRIKNVYDSRIVRKVIKSMISLGSIKITDNGKMTLPEPGEEGWRVGMDRARNKLPGGGGGDIDVLPDENELDDLQQPLDADDNYVPDEDEDDEESIDINATTGIAAHRLGYKRPSNDPVDGEFDLSDEEDKGKKSWYK
ncbi:MAG: hypothetical protein WC905_03760 [Patescibacteria group bacterium]|jgi:hypothetical protein